MGKFDWRSLLRYQGGSVLMIVCGGILTVAPDSASVLVSAVLGWLLIAVGAALLIAGFVGGGEIVTILQGVCLLLGGAWLHRHPLMLASVLGIVLGLLALGQGWQRARRAGRMKRYGGFWVFDGLMAAVELLVGLLLIVSPLIVSRLVLTVAGIFLVICGAADLAAFWKDGRCLGEYGNIIDADK